MGKMKTYDKLTKIANNDNITNKDWEETFNALTGKNQKQASSSAYQDLLKIIDGDK